MHSIKWQCFRWPWVTPNHPNHQNFCIFRRLPWQRPLTSRKICYRSIICTWCTFIWCKECENGCSRSGDIWWNTPVFWPHIWRSQMSPDNSRLTAKTTGPIFTKIVHDIIALVASSIKTKSCYDLVNVQRMHVVSVCLHFGKIILLPSQRPLINWEKSYRSIICT